MSKITYITVLSVLLSGYVALCDSHDANEAVMEKAVEVTQSATDVNQVVENIPDAKEMKSEKIADVNAVKALDEKEWASVKKASDSTDRSVSALEPDDRMKVYRAFSRQTEAELAKLKQIAQDEDAENTVNAIDRIMAMHKESYDAIMDKAKNDKRNAKDKAEGKEARSRETRSREDRRRSREDRRPRTRRSRRDDQDADGPTP